MAIKRITKLEISNFRAFFDSYTVELNKGENLLIYGENGSGKSSFYKSLNNFLSSSQDTAFPFIRHHNKDTEEGNVTLTFNDYDLATNTITSSFGEVINFGTDSVTTHTEQFLKTAELTKGFLDYRGLLAVYNHPEAQPNLFKLIVEILLKNFTSVAVPNPQPLGERFQFLNTQISRAYTTSTWQYRNAIPDMAAFEVQLRTVLNKIFFHLNGFLIKYFKLNLRVWYSLTPFVALPNNWRGIPADLKLEIKLNGKMIAHQSDYLNEARLSALGICLYLAILKRNAQLIDYKVLFLDDVFIGLDLTNRLPILDIIKNEFSDYQVFISTYDRHLYELAKRKFEIETPDRWKSIELFVGKDLINNEPVDRPILVVDQKHFEKAAQYLHDRQKPDYPAAANYFRKALEELIQNYLPLYEKVDLENKVQIPDYKLGPLIYRLRQFLKKTSTSTNSLDEIITLLPSLLHPLSHHEITSPIYRGELLIIENQIPKLISQLEALDIPNHFKCSSLEGKTKVRLKFIINPALRHFSFYELKTSEPLVLIRKPGGITAISSVRCFTEKCWGEINGVRIQGSRKEFNDAEKGMPQNNFDSLQETYDRLHAFVITIPAIGAFAKAANYLDAFEYLDQQGYYQSITNAIVW